MENGFKNFETKETIPLKKIEEGYSDIRKYNEDQISKRSFSNVFMKAWKLEDNEKESLDDKINDLENRKAPTYEEIKYLHNHNFQKIGLEVVAIDKKDEDPEAIFILIKRMNEFNEYLHDNLSQKKLTVELISFLDEVSQNLNEEILHDARESTPVNQGELVDRMMGVDSLIEEYKRIDQDNKSGILTNLKETEQYLVWYEKGELRDNIIAGMYGFDRTFEQWKDGFGPAKWHTDNSPERYQSSWDNILSVLNGLKHNQKLYTENIDKLLKAVEYAKNDINENSKIKYPGESRYDEFLKTLDGAYHKLKTMEFED